MAALFSPGFIFAPSGIVNSEAAAIIAAMTPAPSSARASHVDEVVGMMIAANVWAVWDGFYFPAAHGAQPGRVNWVDPGTFDLVEVDGPIHTEDVGYAAELIGSGYIDTGFNPTTAPSPKFTQNSACAFVRAAASAASGRSAFGSLGTNNVQVLPILGANALMRLCGASALQAANASAEKVIAANRTDSLNIQLYLAGASAATSASNASAALASGNFVACRGNSSNTATWFDEPISSLGFGMELDATQHSDLSDIVEFYLAGL
jgi:hypothetical protein